MADKLRALSMLAGKEASGDNFFEVASRALVLGLDCRWAGFGKRAASKQDIDIIAFCDSGALAPIFSYSLYDSPCGEVYKRKPDDPFCEFPEDVTDLFTGPEVLSQIGAFSYRGEAIFSPNDDPLAHVFTIHDGPQDWTPEDTAFFRMVAQRAGAEYNRRQAEAELVAARDRAEASDRAKTEFLTNTSHELRTPLNSIIGLSDLMATAGVSSFSDEDSAMYLGEIRKAGVTLLDLINDLLDISRIEMGYLDLNEETLDLHACFDDCRQIVRGMLFERKITVEVDPASAPLTLFADRKALMRVLTNLIGNAIKFSNDGGAVALKAGVNADGQATIDVVDHGIGIADSDLDQVLSYFGQVDGGLDRAHSGTGIGLPMAKQLTELHGGTLSIQSTVGVGTTVRILLPERRLMTGTATSSAA